MPVREKLVSTTNPTLNDPDGETLVVEMNVDVLLETGMFIQANSGGGKSLLLRRIFEQTHGRAQQLLFDPEGEFHTLREKHDLVYAAPSGADCVATPETAHKLIRRLLELGASAVIDINDLSPPQRVVFMKNALTSMMTAPRDLWHQVMVGIDEVQKFAPQDYETKADRECRTAVIDLAGQGRKRGYRLIAAAQRISAVAKGVVAELNNFAIGRTSLDVDIKRARGVIGMSLTDAAETLPRLDPHEFFVVGPALANVVTKMRTGRVVTTHPRSGARRAPPTPTPAAVRKMLSQLADLPAEVKSEADEVDRLRAQVRLLEDREKAFQVERGQPSVDSVKLQAEVDRAAVRLEALQRQLTDAERMDQVQRDLLETTSNAIDRVINELTDLRNEIPDRLQDEVEEAAAAGPVAKIETNGHAIQPRAHWLGMSGLPAMLRAFLTVLAQHPKKPLTKAKILVYAGYRAGGATSKAFAEISRNEWWSVAGPSNAGYVITAKGREALGPFKPLPKRLELRAEISSHLGTMERKIFELVCDQYPRPITKGDVLKQTGYSPGGATSKAFAYLAARDWITKQGGSFVRAAEELFE